MKMTYPIETKEIEVRGNKYVIKRWTVAERDEFNNALTTAKKNSDAQSKLVYLCLVDPKIENEADIPVVLDANVYDVIYASILDFNKPEPDFLSLLKSLLPQQLPPSPTNESSQKPTSG